MTEIRVKTVIAEIAKMTRGKKRERERERERERVSISPTLEGRIPILTILVHSVSWRRESLGSAR